MSDIQFPEGFIASRKEGVPDYVLAKVWIKKSEFLAWLNDQPDDSINLEILRSKQGKVYAKVDDWKPEQREARQQVKQAASAPGGFDDSDSIPF